MNTQQFNEQVPCALDALLPAIRYHLPAPTEDLAKCIYFGMFGKLPITLFVLLTYQIRFRCDCYNPVSANALKTKLAGEIFILLSVLNELEFAIFNLPSIS